MKIAIIGTGNVGAALATGWSQKGHEINIGVRSQTDFKGKHLLENPNTRLLNIMEAVQNSEVILIATPALFAVDVAKSLGDTTGKVIIDTGNIVMGRGPVGFTNTTDAILANTTSKDVVKCFNTTGFNNMQNPNYGNFALDMFMAGNSELARKIATELSTDLGFENCYCIGGNEKFEMMEQYAMFWINLAMMQGMGRDIGFKLLKR